MLHGHVFFVNDDRVTTTVGPAFTRNTRGALIKIGWTTGKSRCQMIHFSCSHHLPLVVARLEQLFFCRWPLLHIRWWHMKQECWMALLRIHLGGHWTWEKKITLAFWGCETATKISQIMAVRKWEMGNHSVRLKQRTCWIRPKWTREASYLSRRHTVRCCTCCTVQKLTATTLPHLHSGAPR